ncbi:MAG: hypothetical protein KDE29_17065, partial [Anaerolineales bacterium]|nr:hypothetical protein [Anaerolineales bacterium]
MAIRIRLWYLEDIGDFSGKRSRLFTELFEGCQIIGDTSEVFQIFVVRFNLQQDATGADSFNGVSVALQSIPEVVEVGPRIDIPAAELERQSLYAFGLQR